MEFGPTPCDESCLQVPYNDPQAARNECKRYALQLTDTFDFLEVYFSVKSFPHDFGSYYEVVGCCGDETIEQLYFVESNLPATWLSESEIKVESVRLRDEWELRRNRIECFFPKISVLRYRLLYRALTALGITFHSEYGVESVKAPDKPECQRALWEALYCQHINLDYDWLAEPNSLPYYICAPKDWEFNIDRLFLCQLPAEDCWAIIRSSYALTEFDT